MKLITHSPNPKMLHVREAGISLYLMKDAVCLSLPAAATYVFMDSSTADSWYFRGSSTIIAVVSTFDLKTTIQTIVR